MYESIFHHIVRKLNQCQVNKEGTSLNVVDIYGFECFDTNRFDQLCINYVNEKLQQKYLNDIIYMCMEEYADEGIDLFDTSKFDNSERLQLLEGRFGIMNSINEECVRPKGSPEVRSSLVQRTLRVDSFSHKSFYRNSFAGFKRSKRITLASPKMTLQRILISQSCILSVQ